jgi:hypothetical protein
MNSTSSNPITAVATWSFLNEPLYRWGLFFLAVGAMGVAWDGIIAIMREG